MHTLLTFSLALCVTFPILQADRAGKPLAGTPLQQQSTPSTPSAVGTPHSDATDRSPSVFAKAVILNTDDKWAEDYYGLEAGGDSVHGGSAYGGSQTSGASQQSAASQRVRGCLEGLKKYKSLLIAMLMCQVCVCVLTGWLHSGVEQQHRGQSVCACAC